MLRYLERLDDVIHRRIVNKKRELESMGKLTTDHLDKIEKAIEVEYVYHTNSIEGNTLTLGETKQVLNGMTISNKPLSDIQEIKNNPDAIKLVKHLAFSPKENIRQQDILTLHGISMYKVMEDAGKYRQDDYIKVEGADFTPSFWYEIDKDMNDLMQFINENPDGLSPIELAAHTHYFFVLIHPFQDGNGRIARLLTNFILLRNHYPFVVFKNVDRNQYLRTLRKANKGYFEPFLLYTAGILEQSLDTYLSAIKGDRKEDTERFLPLSTLAKNTPYDANYLRVLANRRVIDAVKKGKTWFTTRKVLDSYIQQHQSNIKTN
jgi:cell filamentation protein, protein adenylyltransferase